MPAESVPHRPSGNVRARREPREVLIRAGLVALRARLIASPMADRIWASLPIYAAAEIHGGALLFAADAGRDREAGARDLVGKGDIAFWADEGRIVMAWGTTPLTPSRKIRLPAPCNVWAVALDDMEVLAAVSPGERVAVLVAES